MPLFFQRLELLLALKLRTAPTAARRMASLTRVLTGEPGAEAEAVEVSRPPPPLLRLRVGVGVLVEEVELFTR